MKLNQILRHYKVQYISSTTSVHCMKMVYDQCAQFVMKSTLPLAIPRTEFISQFRMKVFKRIGRRMKQATQSENGTSVYIRGAI